MGLEKYTRKEIIGEGSFGKVSCGEHVLQKSLPPHCNCPKLQPYERR